MSNSKSAAYILFFLISVVVVLSAIGLIMLYSTSAAIYGEEKLKNQLIWLVLGIFAAVLIHKVDYRKLGSLSFPILLLVSAPLFYLAIIHLLSIFGVSDSVFTNLPFVGNGPVKGSYRWLRIGGRTIQPSEFAKLAIIIYLARYYGTNPRYVKSFKLGLLKPMAVVGAVILAILLGGSFSVTIITGSVVASMLFVAGIRLRYFLILLAIGITMVLVVVEVSPERASRITTFRNPEKFKDSSGYQLYSSHLALGSGHWFGVGFNQSRMKEYYLPEVHTDFIMSIVGEELGFVAMVVIMVLYLLFVASAFLLSKLAVDREGMFLAFGIGVTIGMHSFINVGVVSGFVPTTGVTAPLISYGGSSMLMTWICIGILGSIARTIQGKTDVVLQKNGSKWQKQALNARMLRDLKLATPKNRKRSFSDP